MPRKQTSSSLNRRRFLQRVAAGAALLAAPAVLPARAPSDKLNIGFDAVVVSTTEHTHAFATLPALQRKKHVYCEKPLTHNLHEARLIREAAEKTPAEPPDTTRLSLRLRGMVQCCPAMRRTVMKLPEFLTEWPFGEIVLTGHRIGLYHVVYDYNQGYSPEQLHEEYPTLPLELINKVLAFYKANQSEVDDYMVRCQEEMDRRYAEHVAAGRGIDWDALRRRFEAMKQEAAKQAENR